MSEEKEPKSENLTEDISEFNRQLDLAIERLNEWRTNLVNIQETFIEKLKKRTLNMKVQ